MGQSNKLLMYKKNTIYSIVSVDICLWLYYYVLLHLHSHITFGESKV